MGVLDGAITGQNAGVVGQSSMWTVLIAMIIIFAVVIIMLIRREMQYNKYTDVYELVGTNYKLHRVKGGIFKDDKGVRYFKSKPFGKNGKCVNYREPSNELFTDYETNLFNIPIMPKVQVEQISFLNPFGDTFIPVRRSFITLKRGKDLRITSKEDCEFCQKGVDMEDFLKDPKKHLSKIQDMDHICEKHFGALVNARYECIDQSDLSWMWKKIDDIKDDFGSFLTKYGALIAGAGILIFVIAAIMITYKMQPDIAEAVFQHNKQYIEALKIKGIEAARNVTIPTN